MKSISVKVVAEGYIDIAESEDPQVAARVLGIIMEHEMTNPKTPEQVAVETLRDELETMRSELSTMRYQKDNLQKKLDEATKAPEEA